jgi:hypothetical protein
MAGEVTTSAAKKPDAWAQLGTAAVPGAPVPGQFDALSIKSQIPIYSDEQIQKRIDQARARVSGLCAVYYGFDGTGKTGAAMDCRTAEEIERGAKIYVIDQDQNAMPTWADYHNCDPNIIIMDPIVIGEDGHEDPLATYGSILSYTRYILRKTEAEEVKMSIYDGIDSMLKTCEQVMKIVDLKQDPLAKVKDNWDWGYRNQKFQEIITNWKRMNSWKVFITHMKEKKQWVPQSTGGKKLEILGYEPNWENKFPDRMIQKVEFKKETINNEVVITGVMQKSNGNLALEGSPLEVARVSDIDKEVRTVKWNGLWKLYNNLGYTNAITARKVA